MSEFTDNLGRAGLLGKPSVQQQAIDDLVRELGADAFTYYTRSNGDRVVRFHRHDQASPVGRAVVTREGQNTTDVTEDIT